MQIRRFFRRAKADRDQLEQIESYLQIETDENIARGMAADEARAAAQRKFGNSLLVREEIYRMNTLSLFDTLTGHLRYGWRTLRRNPAFTLTVLLTLTIGIGANTAVFSVVNKVLLKPLPYPDSDRLVSVAAFGSRRRWTGKRFRRLTAIAVDVCNVRGEEPHVPGNRYLGRRAP